MISWFSQEIDWRAHSWHPTSSNPSTAAFCQSAEVALKGLACRMAVLAESKTMVSTWLWGSPNPLSGPYITPSSTWEDTQNTRTITIRSFRDNAVRNDALPQKTKKGTSLLLLKRFSEKIWSALNICQRRVRTCKSNAWSEKLICCVWAVNDVKTECQGHRLAGTSTLPSTTQSRQHKTWASANVEGVVSLKQLYFEVHPSNRFTHEA